MEAEKNIRKIIVAVQPDSGSRHPMTFVGILGGNPSIKMAGMVSLFQSEEYNSIRLYALEEYALTSLEAACEDPG